MAKPSPEKVERVNSSFNSLAQSETFIRLLRHAELVGIDKNAVWEQADCLVRSGRDVETVEVWLEKLVEMAQKQKQAQERIEKKNMGQPMSENQMIGQEERFSDNHMPPGTYFQLNPVVHCSQLNTLNMSILIELYKECTNDPDRKNPYGFHSVPINEFLDKASYMTLLGQKIDSKIEVPGEFEEVEVTDSTTDNPSDRNRTKKIPKMKDNPLVPLYELFITKFKELKDHSDLPPYFFEEILKDPSLSQEARDIFIEDWESQRRAMQDCIRIMQTYQYVSVNTASPINHPKEITPIACIKTPLTRGAKVQTRK